MKLKYFSSYLALGILALTIGACNDAEYSEIDNGLYIAEAGPMDAFNQQVETQLVDDSNIERTFTVRMARPVSQDVAVKLEIDESMIATYNAEHETQYQMLPKEYLEMPDLETVIPAGEVMAPALNLTIKPFTTPNQEQYAVPVKIASVSGPVAVTGRGDRLLLLLTMPNKQKSVVLKYMHKKEVPFKATIPVTEWSFEYWIKVNNTTEYPIEPWYGESKQNDPYLWKRRYMFADDSVPIYLDGDEQVYLRYYADNADGIGPTLQCQMDGVYFDSTPFWYPEKWFHITYTYDGANMVLYKDGVKNAEKAVSKNFAFNKLLLCSGGFSATQEVEFAQIRLWSKCLKPAAIVEGMSRQLPDDTADLIGYWPCNEGQGAVLKDHSGNGYDIDFEGKAPGWSDKIYNFAHPND